MTNEEWHKKKGDKNAAEKSDKWKEGQMKKVTNEKRDKNSALRSDK